MSLVYSVLYLVPRLGIVYDVSRSSGKWLLSANCAATLRNNVFFFLHGVSSSILLYLSICESSEPFSLQP